MSAPCPSNSFACPWRDVETPIAGGYVNTRPLGDDVHIWLAPLDLEDHYRAAIEGGLSADERDRAARYHFDRDRERFVARRALMRMILASYVREEAGGDVKPDDLVFGTGENGKPFLGGAHQGVGISFNLSVSGGFALLAVARGEEIGVDIEAVRKTPDLELVAQENFSKTERDALAHVEKEDWLEAFYCCWTRKEAVVKALGDGLLAPLQEFDVSLEPRKSAELLTSPPSTPDASSWTLQGFRPVLGHWGALAVARQAFSVAYFRLNPGQNGSAI